MPRYYSDPKAPNCPRAGWDFIIKDNFTKNDKAKNAKNRGWRTEAEIDEIVTAVLARNKYEAAKKKVLKTRKGTKLNDYSKYPELKALREECKLFLKDKYKSYSVKLRVGTEEYSVYRSSEITNPDTGKQETIKTLIQPIEKSYDVVKEIHESHNHMSGNALSQYMIDICMNCFPRDVVKQFPKYCLVCREKKFADEKRRNDDRKEAIKDKEIIVIEDDEEEAKNDENVDAAAINLLNLEVDVKNESSFSLNIVMIVIIPSRLTHIVPVDEFKGDYIREALLHLSQYVSCPPNSFVKDWTSHDDLNEVAIARDLAFSMNEVTRQRVEVLEEPSPSIKAQNEGCIDILKAVLKNEFTLWHKGMSKKIICCRVGYEWNFIRRATVSKTGDFNDTTKQQSKKKVSSGQDNNQTKTSFLLRRSSRNKDEENKASSSQGPSVFSKANSTSSEQSKPKDTSPSSEESEGKETSTATSSDKGNANETSNATASSSEEGNANESPNSRNKKSPSSTTKKKMKAQSSTSSKKKRKKAVINDVADDDLVDDCRKKKKGKAVDEGDPSYDDLVHTEGRKMTKNKIGSGI